MMYLRCEAHDGEVEELVPAVPVLQQDGVTYIHAVVVQAVCVEHLSAVLRRQPEYTHRQAGLLAGQRPHLGVEGGWVM